MPAGAARTRRSSQLSLPEAKQPRKRPRAAPGVTRSHELDEAPARICVVGVGGGGCNAIVRMLKAKSVPGVRYVGVNTDVKSLGQMRGVDILQIGEALTRGLGAGGVPEVGGQAAETDRKKLKDALKGPDLVFLAAGMGGGTGTGAAPVVADVARKAGALVVAVVTTPFSFEGRRRQETALSGVSGLRDRVDNVIVIHNDRLLHLFGDEDVSMEEALRRADDAVMLGVLSVAELVNVPGEINVDLADVKSIMKLPGRALMAIGESKGPGGALEAARQAVNNPLLDLAIDGARGVLFNVTGGRSLKLNEVNATGEFILSRVDSRAMIFFGMGQEPSWKDRVRVTLIATGIPEGSDLGYGDSTNLASVLRGESPSANGLDLDVPPFLRRPDLFRGRY
jgi:cell division protein FtsZ